VAHTCRSPAVAVAVGAAVFLAATSCGDDNASSTASTASTISTSGPEVEQTTTTSIVAPATSTYVSSTFVVPFSVTVDQLLVSPPSSETANLVSWHAADSSSDSKVRFLVPVEVHPPLTRTAQPPPDDFVAYVQGLSAESGEITDVSQITVDGQPATLMSVSPHR